ncbi:hypothetical protein Hte_000245 [Hypoxylon texense]
MATTTATKAKFQLEAVFNYYAPPTPPELDDLSILNGTSPDTVSCQVPVVDLRATAPLSTFTHESHGFQILHQPLPIDASHASVHDPAVLASRYYPSIIALLKAQLGARSVVVINSTLRDIPAPNLDGFDPGNPRPTTGAGSLGPFFIAHSDYTPGAVRAHLRAVRPDWFAATGTADPGTTSLADQELFFRLRGEIIAAEDRAAGLQQPGIVGQGDGKGGTLWNWDGKGYAGPRYAMFSIWRPWEPVRRDPLAVLVGGAAEGDGFLYVPLPRLYRNRPGCASEYANENALVRPPTPERGHVWGYLSVSRSSFTIARRCAAAMGVSGRCARIARFIPRIWTASRCGGAVS